ncbi:MAG: NADH-quinone oxidoreductase subunit J [Odoribacter sp.]|nr:NADH-quinone oxidoreductase subunit J [Odoribacter sp.]MDY3034464.1 NADH-quinone oxidoreductase subunit J [Odoribacter sp.]
MTLPKVVFLFLATVIVVFSILTVTTKRILRSATYLLFVLFATAGIYFELNYSFLGAVQLTVYAGGIIVLYVFSILLTSSDNQKVEKIKRSKYFAGIISAGAGAAICIFITLTHSFPVSHFTPGELNQKVLGTALMGMDKYQYLLPFEAISVLLLACIIGGILIARKR